MGMGPRGKRFVYLSVENLMVFGVWRSVITGCLGFLWIYELWGVPFYFTFNYSLCH